MDNKESFITNHAPLILAALITRRTSSHPESLTTQAISTISKLYDEISFANSGDGAMGLMLDALYGKPVERDDGWYVDMDGPYPSEELCRAARQKSVVV